MTMGLPEIFRAEKALSSQPDWLEAENKKLHFLVPLEIGGVTVEGLSLRGRTLKDRPDEEVMFQMEAWQPKRRDHAIARLDWRPLHVHNNQGRGPTQLRFSRIAGTHHHSFDLNWFEPEGRLLSSNLPVAEPVEPDLAGFSGLLEFVRKCFRISNIGLVPVPPWEADLL